MVKKMRTHEIEKMLQALRRIQAERYYSLAGLAHILGFSTGYLSMIFAGKRRPSTRFVQAAIAQFPEIMRSDRRSGGPKAG